ncbi:MAG TPA: hypothetical protein VLH83_06465, partial [Chthoniobacterales bacterium]|nr:hypothetical protein [Chthoniobacterales bacterium]
AAYLIWRTMLVCSLGTFAVRQLKTGQLLPILLYAAGFLSLLNGQFGQPTNLGFAVFICGLALAAGNPSTSPGAEPMLSSGPPRRRIARRSRYAEQLHGAGAAPPRPDDFADR